MSNKTITTNPCHYCQFRTVCPYEDEPLPKCSLCPFLQETPHLFYSQFGSEPPVVPFGLYRSIEELAKGTDPANQN